MVTVDIVDNSAMVIAAKNAAIKRALEMIGLQAEGYAKSLAPVDTGRLRNSINHTQISDDTEQISAPVEYAVYQEFGTMKMAAHPFMKPAVMDHTAEYKAIAESCMRGA